MRLRFLGAAREVTGSCYHVEVDSYQLLVDCGFHQGMDDAHQDATLEHFDAKEIKALLLTHAHMDHAGRIPYLVRCGFSGTIWSTAPTAELVEVLWRDSARLMRDEAEWKTRKALRRGEPSVEPLFTEKDVDAAVKLLSPVEHGRVVSLTPTLSFVFHEAGHILGSASIRLESRVQGEAVRVVFSGDLGQYAEAVDAFPNSFAQADYVLIESTYGNREHKSVEDTRLEFREVVSKALRERGKIIIPSFVVDRAQRILFELTLMQQDKEVPEIPIFFDSPMGVKATELYQKYSRTLSEEVRQLEDNGVDVFAPKVLKMVTTSQESRSINEIPCGVVIAGSGMCTGGRIIHHLKHNAWNAKNHIVFVGYQARGTLGRRIVEGQKKLKIAGETIALNATVHTIGGFSAHAGRADLLRWAKCYQTDPLFFVVHGEPIASKAFANTLREHGMRAVVPSRGQTYCLNSKRDIKERNSLPSGYAGSIQELRLEIESILQDVEEHMLEALQQNNLQQLEKLCERLHGLCGDV